MDGVSRYIKSDIVFITRQSELISVTRTKLYYAVYIACFYERIDYICLESSEPLV